MGKYNWLFPHPPPRDLSDPDRTYNWMFSVFLVSSITGGIVLANTLLTWGMVPILFSGFATAADLKKIDDGQMQIQRSVDRARDEVQMSNNDIKATIISQNLYNLRIMQCNYLKARNGPAVESMEAQITQKKMEYFEATGNIYMPSPCENLGIVP